MIKISKYGKISDSWDKYDNNYPEVTVYRVTKTQPFSPKHTLRRIPCTELFSLIYFSCYMVWNCRCGLPYLHHFWEKKNHFVLDLIRSMTNLTDFSRLWKQCLIYKKPVDHMVKGELTYSEEKVKGKDQHLHFLVVFTMVFCK